MACLILQTWCIQQLAHWSARWLYFLLSSYMLVHVVTFLLSYLCSHRVLILSLISSFLSFPSILGLVRSVNIWELFLDTTFRINGLCMLNNEKRKRLCCLIFENLSPENFVRVNTKNKALVITKPLLQVVSGLQPKISSTILQAYQATAEDHGE